MPLQTSFSQFQLINNLFDSVVAVDTDICSQNHSQPSQAVWGSGGGLSGTFPWTDLFEPESERNNSNKHPSHPNNNLGGPADSLDSPVWHRVLDQNPDHFFKLSADEQTNISASSDVEDSHSQVNGSILNATNQFTQYGYTNDLVIPGEIDLTKRSHVTLQVRENDWDFGIYDQQGEALTTTVWGYGIGRTGGYLGPTLLTEEGSPVTVTWQNQLPLTGHLLPVDYSIHRADPVVKALEDGYTPIVTHLHGAESDSDSDGYPEAWYTQTKGPKGPAEVGPFYSGNRYTYDNEQEAAPLWYHDHALGITRLNVYAGLAGFYQLTDDNERALVDDGVLPEVRVPLVIQDKAFTEEGALYFPGYEDDPLPDGEGGSGSVEEEVGESFFEENGEDAASALPEFFGDHILVNGTAWPNLDVGQGSYRFDLVNGSDSRFYVLDFDGDTDGIAVYLVAGDGGLLPNAIELGGPFTFAPGDRVSLVVDFTNADPGDTIRLLNSGPDYSPFKGYADDHSLIDAEAATPDDPVGNVMQFTVDDAIPAETASVTDGSLLNPDYVDITGGPFDEERKLGLFEGADEYGRVQPLLGTAEEGSFHVYAEDGSAETINDFGPLNWFDATTETPVAGTTEKWEVFNFTADAHPVHLHLTQYQAIGRRDIAFEDADEDGVPDDTTGDGEISYGHYSDPGLDIDYSQHDVWISDQLQALAPEEQGRQDTVWVGTGQMLEIAAEFEKAGQYVWHCHILSHEDHDMMRPLEVQEPDGFYT